MPRSRLAENEGEFFFPLWFGSGQYRCTRKTGVCSEPYTQEKLVVAQCLEFLKPLAISPEEADFARALIDEETQNDGQALEAESEQIAEKLANIQKKLNKLTRGYLDELIDEESYQASKESLVLEKAALKAEKQRLHKSRSGFWNEPAKEAVNIMELAGKLQTVQSPEEIAELVRKTGTNRLISRKTVTISFSEQYDFIPSLLAFPHVSTPDQPSSRSDKNWWRTTWCA